MNADERAKFLEDDDEIEVQHVSAADQGQSDQIAPDAIVNNHFICFSNVDNHIYELDGRKQFPINHGPTTEETFLADIAQIVKSIMERGITYTKTYLTDNTNIFYLLKILESCNSQ